MTMTGRQRFLAALRREPVDRPPFWFMRQAGRHLPGYRSLRSRLSFLDICREPEANARVSREPWNRYGTDGVIVFNDILIPLRDMGMGLEFDPGPRFDRLIATAGDAAALKEPDYASDPDVSRCIGAIRGTVGEGAGVLGFVGAPLTVAAFAVAGSGPQRLGPLSGVLAERREAVEGLSDRLVGVLGSYAGAQVRAGADVIQVFESLAEEAGPELYREVGLPRLLALVAELGRAAPGTPVIVFGRGLWPYLLEIARAGPAAVSLDWSRPLSAARRELAGAGLETALQGNLPPAALTSPPGSAAEAAEGLLSDWASIVPHPERADELGPTGWVFNLGHGVPAEADPASVLAVARAVRGFEAVAGPVGGREARA